MTSRSRPSLSCQAFSSCLSSPAAWDHSERFDSDYWLPPVVCGCRFSPPRSGSALPRSSAEGKESADKSLGVSGRVAFVSCLDVRVCVLKGGELLAACKQFSSLVLLFLEVTSLFVGGGVRKLETDPA